ncbi:MAG: hypothetical protein ACRCX8_05110 [Sarcina sp.]
MGEELQISDCYIEFDNGERHKLDMNTCIIQTSSNKEYPCLSFNRFIGSGNMTITNMNKYEFFRMLNKYIKGDEWIAKQYKHLKRCRNRRVLHEKRR